MIRRYTYFRPIVSELPLYEMFVRLKNQFDGVKKDEHGRFTMVSGFVLQKRMKDAGNVLRKETWRDELAAAEFWHWTTFPMNFHPEFPIELPCLRDPR